MTGCLVPIIPIAPILETCSAIAGDRKYSRCWQRCRTQAARSVCCPLPYAATRTQYRAAGTFLAQSCNVSTDARARMSAATPYTKRAAIEVPV